MLCDTGPLVAIVDRRQRDHERCRQYFRSRRLPLLTTWSCWTEAMYFAAQLGGHHFQQLLWELIDDVAIEFHEHDSDDVLRIRSLMHRYQNVPMDLADASLMAAAESANDREIFTLDADFRIYRFDDGGSFQVRPE